MIAPDHPYFFLEEVFSKQDAVFEFSRYVYTPDSLFDERETLLVKSNELTHGWLEAVIASLGAEQELALHSRVAIGRRTFHIPMIDFSAPELSLKTMERVRAFLPTKVFKATSFYQSGRSFHCYSRHLLGPRDWLDFMGRLLLISPPREHQVVDTRWIGHRLIAGYSALRLSNSSGRYVGMPKQIGIDLLFRGVKSVQFSPESIPT